MGTGIDILSTLAQGAYYYSPYAPYQEQSSNALASGASVLFLTIFGLLLFFISVGMYVLIALCLMQIFKKAGVKPWIAWVPFYNNWKLLEIGGQQGFWSILTIVPILNIVSAVFMYIAMYNIGLKFGKDDLFVLIAIFVAPIWFILLAFDKSPWNDAAGRPSLAPEATHSPKNTKK